MYSLSLPALYSGAALAACLSDAHAHGFPHVETWTLGNAMALGLPKLLKQNGLHLTAFCPDCFVLNDPAARTRYVQGIRDALKNAKCLDCHGLITQVGQDNGLPRQVQHESIVAGLREVAPLLEDAGITLLVEPLNTVKDHKGYYLDSSAEGFGIIREVDSPCVKLCYDIYHQLHMGEDVLTVIQENLPLIGHFHAAGFPNRDERLFEGGYDYRPLLDWLNANTSLPIGLELFPSTPEAREKLFETLRGDL